MRFANHSIVPICKVTPLDWEIWSHFTQLKIPYNEAVAFLSEIKYLFVLHPYYLNAYNTIVQ